MRMLHRSFAVVLGLALSSVVAGGAIAGAPAFARADGPAKTVTVEVDMIHASKAAGPADPKADRFKAQLGDFNFQSYKHVGEKKVSVTLGQAETVPLAGGKELKITFSKVDKDGRARLKLAIKGVVETSVSLADKGSVVLGGPALPHGDGVLFVPVTLHK
jgi:hypothetical protein